jgi:MFS family permease
MKLQKEKITDKQRRKLYRQAIASQTLGMQGMLAFGNGIMLLYMTALGISPARIITYLALPLAISVILRLPVAYKLDQIGLKKFGTLGVFLTSVGFAIIPIGGFFSTKQAEIIIVIGISVLAIGKTLFAPTWMPILDSFVNPEERGQFFSKLRLSIQFLGLCVSGLTAWYIKSTSGGEPPLYKYMVVLFFLSLCLFGRVYFYSRIPEIEDKDKKPNVDGFFKSIREILSNGDFISFCLYIFMLILFTAGCANLFSLIEKDVMNLDGSYIILLSNTTTIGAMVGLFIGGKVIDKYGSRYAFLICHLAFVFTIALFLLRNQFFMPIVLIAIAHFSLGLIGSFSGLARSTETLALIPAHNKSLSTSVALCMILGAQSLSGLMSAWAISANIINPSWTLFGDSMSAFDGILLIYGVMTFLLIVTLVLVPSVLRKAAWGAIPN